MTFTPYDPGQIPSVAGAEAGRPAVTHPDHVRLVAQADQVQLLKQVCDLLTVISSRQPGFLMGRSQPDPFVSCLSRCDSTMQSLLEFDTC